MQRRGSLSGGVGWIYAKTDDGEQHAKMPCMFRVRYLGVLDDWIFALVSADEYYKYAKSEGFVMFESQLY